MILELKTIIDLFFKDENRILEVKKGDTVIEAGIENDKLFYVLEGSMSVVDASGSNPNGFLVIHKGEFAGIQSFIDDKTPAQLTLMADEDCKLSYITKRYIENETFYSLEKVIAPVFLAVAKQRQRRLYELMLEQEAERINAENQSRLDALGQFSAGVAHELNNAIAVIEQAGRWLPDVMQEFMSKRAPELSTIFKRGLESERSDSKTQRERSKVIAKEHGLSPNLSRKCAQAKLDDFEIEVFLKGDIESNIKTLHQAYEMGSVMNNLRISGDQASSVVESMRNLGSKTSIKGVEISILESIERTLSILRNVSKGIQIEVIHEEDDFKFYGNKGELVQVWTNIIKNCCEALRQNEVAEPVIHLKIQQNNDALQIEITDNGPGIPTHLLRKIFQPNYTTKKSGLNFGLGLGLSIVQKIVESYGGKIHASNVPDGGAKFTIMLPTLSDKDEP
jgi:signal transduction histidine kinase